VRRRLAVAAVVARLAPAAVVQPEVAEAIGCRRRPEETPLVLLSFPYVCPKPVLVKWSSFLHKNGAKMRFFIYHTETFSGSDADEEKFPTVMLWPSTWAKTVFLSFPYVCPEPVLAKWSCLCINGAKRPFWSTEICHVKVGRGTPRTTEGKRHFFWVFPMFFPSLSW
jgi:hypothetical protein